MKFFKKSDEMELSISLTSIKFAWFYTVIFLFLWSIYDFVKTSSFNNSLAFFLLVTQNLIYLCMQIFLKRKMSI